jgi:integrase
MVLIFALIPSMRPLLSPVEAKPTTPSKYLRIVAAAFFGKGRKDRRTMIPEAMLERLRRHLEHVRVQHQADLAAGLGTVTVPDAIAVKYASAPREGRWQWVFPATRHYRERDTGRSLRHHLHETVIQRAIRTAAIDANIVKAVTPHTLRHSSPRTCSRAAMTSERSRSCSATRTSLRR